MKFGCLSATTDADVLIQVRVLQRFFSTGTMLMGFDRCRINAQVFKVRFDLKSLEDRDKQSGISSLAEATVDRFP